MSDPTDSEPATPAVPDPPLEETTPPMKLQQKSADPAEIETLDQTTAPIKSFLGSENPGKPRRRS